MGVSKYRSTFAQTTEGNTEKVNVTDDLTNGLLNGILKEMKIMNRHLSLLTDEEITREEIE